MNSQQVSFVNRQQEALAAVLELPSSGVPQAYALFAHCFTCTKNSRAAVQISRRLAGEGIAVLRFDFTGLGQSEGEFADSNFSSTVDDLVSAAAYLEENYSAPQLLVGHSLGGTAVLHAAGRIPSTRAVIAIGAPAEPAHVLQHLDGAEEELARSGEAEVDLGGRPFRLKRQFVEDVQGRDVGEVVAALKRPLLVMHSPFDKIVSIDHAGTIFKAAKHPKSFISLDTADHLLLDAADAEYTAQVIASWSCRFLQIHRPDPAVEEPDNMVVAELEGRGFRTEISANGHPLVADEPEAVGGTNTGPSPYDLLVAGLGACTAMTLRMYADHKKLPLKKVTVRLKHEKVHAIDCDECESETGKIDRIEREVELRGELTTEQRQRLLEIADRCPVHKTLHSEVAIVSRLAD